MRTVGRWKMTPLFFLNLLLVVSATHAKQVLQHRQLKEEDLLELSRWLEDIQEQETEEVFRRLQSGSSFLNDHLSHATGGNSHYYYGADSGSSTPHTSVTTSSAGQAYSAAVDFAMPQAHGKPPKSGKSRNSGNGGMAYHQDESYGGMPGYYGNSNAGKGKSKKGKSSKADKSKKHKKEKKHRCEYGMVDARYRGATSSWYS